MEKSGRFSEVIHDHDRRAEVGWQISEQAFVCVETAGGAAYANEGEVVTHSTPAGAAFKFSAPRNKVPAP